MSDQPTDGTHQSALARSIGAERHRSRRPPPITIARSSKSVAKLAGGVAVIRVGGATEVEVKERKDRVDDAMHATRAAVEEELPGGGVALLRAAEALKRVRTSNEDQKHGVDIVRKALSWPARQIALNAGEDGSVVVGKMTTALRRARRPARLCAPFACAIRSGTCSRCLWRRATALPNCGGRPTK